jgi:hypothetical protein
LKQKPEEKNKKATERQDEKLKKKSEELEKN